MYQLTYLPLLVFKVSFRQVCPAVVAGEIDELVE